MERYTLDIKHKAFEKREEGSTRRRYGNTKNKKKMGINDEYVIK